jgi:Mg2+/Co2+ transporter CorB
MATPMSPLFNRRATLKDALSLLLDSDVQSGIVVDRHGAMLGIVTADMIAEEMRSGEHVVAAEPFPAEELAGGLGPGDAEVPVEAAAG